MQPDNIQITTYEELGKECANTAIANPYHIAGVLIEDSHILCGDCATQEELEIGHAIFEDSESDYPGIYCDECSKPLDTYQLVYKSQDPELWHQLVWNTQLGHLSNLFTDNVTLAKSGENQAYELGWEYGGPNENSVTYADLESNPQMGEYPTDTAHYANNVEPELRALSGYIDGMGKGTYQEPFRDISYHTFNEGVSPAFHQAYFDRVNQECGKWENWEKHNIFED